ncbi:hypothetical protein IW150_004823, partial [Coemansia sp. RSA 2607]
MESEKQFMHQASCSTNAAAQSNSAANPTHNNAFLHLRLEPSLSSTLMDLLDVLVYPAALSPSVPNTPPPTYEPPPPSYPSSDAWSIASMSTLSLNRITDTLSSLGESDSMSIVTGDLYYDDNYDSGFGSSTVSMGNTSTTSQPELQNQL